MRTARSWNPGQLSSALGKPGYWARRWLALAPAEGTGDAGIGFVVASRSCPDAARRLIGEAESG